MSYEPEIPPSSLSDDAQAYLAREFDRIRLSLDEKTQAGTAGIFLTFGSTIPGPLTITGTATKIVGFNAKTLNETAAFGNLANSTLLPQELGTWNYSVQLIADIVASTANNAREVAILIYNEEDATFLNRAATATVPRYGAQITLSGSATTSLDESMINKNYAMYIYTPDSSTITVNQIEVLEFFTHRVTT